jgi:hypothetical protein
MARMDDELLLDYDEQGRRDALAILSILVSGDEEAADLTTDMMQGFDSHRALAGALGLLLDVLEEHGIDPGGWVARKQDELAAQADG